MSRPTLVRAAIFLFTTVAAWSVLSYGVDSNELSGLEPGDIAPRTYEVVTPAAVVDEVAVEAAQADAGNDVEPVEVPRTEIEEQVIGNIEAFFGDVAATAVMPLPDGPSPALPVETTTTPAPTTTTTTTTVEGDEPEEPEPPPTTTVPPAEIEVSGLLFIDADSDGAFNPEPGPEAEEGGEMLDRPLPLVSVTVASAGRTNRVETQSDGTFTTPAVEGEVTVTVDQADPEFPDDFEVSAGDLVLTAECPAPDPCTFEPVGLSPRLRAVVAIVAILGPDTAIADDSIAVLGAVARQDVVRTAAGGVSHLGVVEAGAIGKAQQLFGARIYETATEDGIDLETARNNATESPPTVFYTDVNELDLVAGRAAAEVVANFLLPNWTFDEAATEALRNEAAAAVIPDDHRVAFRAEEVIVSEGEELTQLHIHAIAQTGSVLVRVQQQGGLLTVLAVMSGVLGMYLARFRPEFWARPRMLALFGLFIVFAAGAVRLTVFLEPSAGWYVMPAVAFGLMTAVLFDSRIGVLMSLAVAILTAVGTRDPGVTVYALLATLVPIGFVSAVSTRRAFRNAAIYASAATAVIAASTSWFFHTGSEELVWESVGVSAAWAFGVSLLASLIGLAALQFFESAFDITTTLALLDLTDRNHEALQLLQEKAFGTFNHSLMVGTLADAAARAIGADPLLARASAYYHDLGKTENPTMFIENQFGITNPHDLMTPAESAEVIRRHVTDGIELAQHFKIPSEVAEGIVSHHGDAIMRYFFEKAREEEPNVDPAKFRHVGHKPRTTETAIVMLADSLEASCRAVFQQQEPTPEAIEKLVTSVIDEKVNDGQLTESPLTLSQLTRMRRAFLDSLVGHYHQRIVYPNFPAS